MEITNRCPTCPKLDPEAVGPTDGTVDCPFGRPVMRMRRTGQFVMTNLGPGEIYEEIPTCPEDLSPVELELALDVKRQLDERARQQPPDSGDYPHTV